MESRFSASAAVKVTLLKGPVYSEDAELWKLLLDHQGPISDYFHDIGLSLVVDPQEGYAYLEQTDVDQDDGMPRLLRRRDLSFEATLLLVILRDELLKFDSTPRAAASVPVVAEEWLVDQMSSFVSEMKNQVKRRTVVEQAIAQAVKAGVLRRLQTVGEGSTYQIMRIIKAKLPEEKLAEIRDRLKQAAEPSEGGGNGDDQGD